VSLSGTTPTDGSRPRRPHPSHPQGLPPLRPRPGAPPPGPPIGLNGLVLKRRTG